jgi:hypothetical protein
LFLFLLAICLLRQLSLCVPWIAAGYEHLHHVQWLAQHGWAAAGVAACLGRSSRRTNPLSICCCCEAPGRAAALGVVRTAVCRQVHGTVSPGAASRGSRAARVGKPWPTPLRCIPFPCLLCCRTCSGPETLPSHTNAPCLPCLLPAPSYLQAGWDVLVVRWPMLALWFPPWSRALAGSLLTALGAELAARGQRPVVFWSFSGAAKVGGWCGCVWARGARVGLRLSKADKHADANSGLHS